ncbi:AraC family transcriptional regulator [Paenibacillus sp. TRM 82003]|nr:AraC family transcriptional regulator [Paenibacillus sp. TRM 82003]
MEGNAAVPKGCSSLNKSSFWNQTIADMRLDVTMAAYTKVPVTWREIDYTPDFNKLYYICEGEGLLRIEDREYRPRPGQLFLLPHGVRQSYATVDAPAATFGKYWCHFRAYVMEEPLFRVVDTPTFVEIPEGEPRERLAATFRELAECHKREGVAAAVRVRSAMLDIVATYFEYGGFVRMRTGKTEAVGKMDRVLRYIDERLSEQLTVEELAETVHFHPNYFIRAFKKTTGLTPIQYVNRKRMEQARRLLATTELTVSAVADAFGMEVSYFSRMFKEQTGFSPSQYRELLP